MSTENDLPVEEKSPTGVPVPGKDTTTVINQKTDEKKEEKSAKQPQKQSSLVGLTWVFAFLGLMLLIFLLVFVLQNLQRVEMTIFTWTTGYPLGVGLLLAAIAGALIMALIGSVRIIQLRRKVKKLQNRENS
ncbi:MAG: lipopolysaccharide assembly protein LapA domain-containing protein [Lawsonella sp.]|nr:DUF1049 domain-containing protein [Mycobacteriales bacterium]